ncbi:hypothetical protein H0O01_04615 [Candidatus Micrarchaeota archaeon]|nr:hypothetical protein [Candidatus Micrarchaeota archaeon]
MKRAIKVGDYTAYVEPYGKSGQIRITIKELPDCSGVYDKDYSGIVPDVARSLIARKLIEMRAERLEKKRPKLRVINGGKDEQKEKGTPQRN